MNHWVVRVIVECDTEEQANQVMAERLGCDEWYGFDYTIDFSDAVEDSLR